MLDDLPPPPKSPSPIYPKIAKSDLPSNHLYDLPPPKIAKSDLPSNRLWRFTPPNCQVQFTLKLPSPIYPQITCTIPPPRNYQVRFTLKSSLAIYPPPNRQVRFSLKLPSPIYPQIVCTIYPPKRQVRFGHMGLFI